MLPVNAGLGTKLYCPVVAFTVNVPVVAGSCVKVKLYVTPVVVPLSFAERLPVTLVDDTVLITSGFATSVEYTVKVMLAVAQSAGLPLQIWYVAVVTPVKPVAGVNEYMPVEAFIVTVPLAGWFKIVKVPFGTAFTSLLAASPETDTLTVVFVKSLTACGEQVIMVTDVLADAEQVVLRIDRVTE